LRRKQPQGRVAKLQYSGKAQILRESSIFSGLNDDELGELANLAIEHSFVSNEFIFWDGDAPEWFYIIAEGKVKVLKHSSLGKEFIVAFFGPGEMFGEVAVFENKSYPASAQTVVETKVVGIKRDKFLSFLANRPQVALGVVSVLAGRLRDAQSGLTLPFTRQEIAEMVGTTTETTIRVMSHLKDREIISTVRGKVIILDEEKLRLLSEGPPQV